MSRRALITASVLLGAALVACAPAATTAPATTTPAGTAPASTAPAPVTSLPVSPTPAAPAPAPVLSFQAMPELTQAPVRSFSSAPAQIIDPNKRYRAVLKTSQGDVTLDLYPKVAPAAVNNFVFLALNHFYDGTRFHRVIDGFMAQGGDPLSADPAQQANWGTGGPGYQFSAELVSGVRFDRAGVLGMARSQSLSSQGSQFFITVAPADFLSGNYTVFGQVIGGQDVLNRLQRNYNNSGPIAGAGADTLLGVQILQEQ
ncbi:peptidylprolyl isomerase [Deinococcus soli (ex Cha et al. 2016)]|uniref:Peptidyl-prolyl cis-trans isomerase n=2 Tax=Deinococcus soli (ex Cha et al. 2016) TaxID=1309411 RepID=A0AAE3XHU3_9DEIO|nr:peptidylprolyl isomerase [Deinococcus soli (ex Cha et al. 2016)]MDR6220420.1 peptidylprolyl isomerase [Deinococcus soli (ex Cha et al. 2016)]MDR6330249.1 peptidylprolyl isomerase [Deinococcus soli (ex Cha et al. 2016)]MDR6753501.1 peptidylprolyl isomerase [Deinococcus soli (ex Cha et al. 2016)]